MFSNFRLKYFQFVSSSIKLHVISACLDIILFNLIWGWNNTTKPSGLLLDGEILMYF